MIENKKQLLPTEGRGMGGKEEEGLLLLVPPGWGLKAQISISRCKCNYLCKEGFKKKRMQVHCVGHYYEPPGTPLCKPHVVIHKDSASLPLLPANTPPTGASGYWYLHRCVIAQSCFSETAVGHFTIN